jgi:hypothetical protein
MGPKIESVLHFLHCGGKEAVITSYEHLCEAATGLAGTRLVCDPEPDSEASCLELEVPVIG